MLQEVKDYILAISKHWAPLATGVTALVVLAMVGFLWGNQVPWWVWISIIAISLLISSFLAWREIRTELRDPRRLLDQRDLKRKAREALSEFLNQGFTIYTKVTTYKDLLHPVPVQDILEWEKRLTKFISIVLGRDYEIGLYGNIRENALEASEDYTTALAWIEQYTNRLKDYISSMRKNDWEGSINLSNEALDLVNSPNSSND